MAIRTLIDLFFHIRQVAAGRSDLFRYHRREGWELQSTTDFIRQVHSLALALQEKIEPGERVAVFSEGRPEGHVVDFACQLLGLPTVPIDPELSQPQIAYILRNSGARWVFYSNAAKRDLLIALQTALTTALHVIAFDGDATVPGGMSITRLMGSGAELRGQVPVERFRDQVGPDDLASLCYTSNGTGDPKGVLLTQHNQVANLLACADHFDLGRADIALSFQPLANLFQRTMEQLCLYRGAAIHYATHAGPENCREIRPTFLAAPATYFESVAKELKETASKRSGWLLRRACEIGQRHAAVRRHGFVGPMLAFARWLADAIVLRPLRRRFGGQLRLAIANGGQLASQTGEFFEAIGLPLYHAYGLIEASPVLALTGPGALRRGSVGKPLASVEIQLAADGEILVRGAGVMRGFWQNPSAAAKMIDDGGWFHTGDVGRIDDSGYLYVDDRHRLPNKQTTPSK